MKDSRFDHAPTKGTRLKRLAAGILAALALPAFAAAQSLPPNTTLYASGLEHPRGLKFGPDGLLYVAEAGTGGANVGKGCAQVPGPVGPYTGGPNARISVIAKNGTRSTVASGFPSTQDAQGDVIGVADVVFLDGTLYAVIGGGGCSHGNPNSPSGIAKVNRSTGKWTLIANVGAWLKTHPSKYESVDDFEPDGTLYNGIQHNGMIYAVEPNHGQVISVTADGRIEQVIDISASEGHIVPTSIASQYGALYVGNLNLFPIDPKWARILTISENGGENFGFAPGFTQHGALILESKAGFTTVVGVDFGPDGLLYALELSDAAGFPTPGDGKVVRVLHSGEIEEVVTGLAVPTGMTFGPDGALYVSNLGAVPAGAAPANAGQVLRVHVTPGW